MGLRISEIVDLSIKGIECSNIKGIILLRGKIPFILGIENRNGEIEGKIPSMVEFHDRKWQACTR
jgi:hypothetical protein